MVRVAALRLFLSITFWWALVQFRFERFDFYQPRIYLFNGQGPSQVKRTILVVSTVGCYVMLYAFIICLFIAT